MKSKSKKSKLVKVPSPEQTAEWVKQLQPRLGANVESARAVIKHCRANPTDFLVAVLELVNQRALEAIRLTDGEKMPKSVVEWGRLMLAFRDRELKAAALVLAREKFEFQKEQARMKAAKGRKLRPDSREATDEVRRMTWGSARR